MTEHFNYGLQKCTGDLIIKIDIDFIFKFDDYNNHLLFRNTLFENMNSIHLMYLPRINYYPKGYFTTNEDIFVLNKYLLNRELKTFKMDRVNGYSNKLVINGQYQTKIISNYNFALYNYDCTFMTKEQYYEKTYRWYIAYYKLFGNLDNFKSNNITNETLKDKNKCIECLLDRLYVRINHAKRKKNFKKGDIRDHPKIIQNRLQNLLDTQYGKNHFNYKLYSEVFER